MEERRELRKLPRGERCPECGSQKFYLQDGLRFCSRGHQIEGFVQFDLGDEEAAGQLGSVVRRKKEAREVEKRQLAGQEGKTLYLEAIQLLLRKQVDFLVRKMGHKEELETVVRDLWDLRIRGYSSVIQEGDPSETDLEMFSSQPVTSEIESRSSWKSSSRAQSWDRERGTDWPLPRLPDTIALCYLGCLLLKIPTRLADLHTWVSNGNLPYLAAYMELPIEMQKRMPSSFANLLKLPSAVGLRGYDLYQTVMNTVLSYKLNYQMTFPEMNYFPMLVQYAKELALPVEVIVVAKRLAATLNYSFEFPAGNARIFPLDHPELRLVAFLVVSTKLCFPFNHGQVSSLVSLRRCMPRFDWERWTTGYSENLAKFRGKVSERPAFEEFTPDQISNLGDEEFDAYVAYLSAAIGSNNENAITKFFPMAPEPMPPPSTSEFSEGQIEKQARSILTEAVISDNIADPGVGRYEAFRVVQDLSETAGIFYKAACDAAGLPIDMMVQAIYKLEQHIIWWQRKQSIFEE